MSDTPISGHVSAGFEPVRAAFEANFEAGAELGAGFCLRIAGDVVVDLVGGWQDRKQTKPWVADTLVPVYSTTKPIAALVLASVIDQLPAGYETPVAEIWPDFAAHGKDRVTIAELTSHQAGLPGFAEEIDPALWLDPEACAAALAAQPPLWPPGTAHGYHPLSWGYLVGAVVQRICGRSLGTVLRDGFTSPSQIDFHIGTSFSEHGRVAELVRPKTLPDLGKINAATRAAFLTRWASADRNATRWREIEIPSANGHGTAGAVAHLFDAYAHGGRIDGREVISPGAFSALTETRALGADLVLPFVTEFACGVMRNNLGLYGPNPDTLCHSGWGGSMALADPEQGLSAAYVMNRQSNSLQGDPRARALVDAAYLCL